VSVCVCFFVCKFGCETPCICIFVSNLAHMGLLNRISVCVVICLSLPLYFLSSFVFASVVKFFLVCQKKGF